MKTSIQTLERQIEKIKQRIGKIGDLRPGSLSEQYNVCGKPGCRCKADPPKKHGPYYQLSYTRKGKSGSVFVKKEDAVRVKRQVKNYALLRSLVDRWIDLAAELADLRLGKKKKSR